MKVRTVGARWVVATGNAGKLAEIEALLRGLDVTLVAQRDVGVEPVEETGSSFIENALIKARHAAQRSGLPAIADDSGLEVYALAGAPGIRSARYAGPEADESSNVAALLAAMAGLPDESRGARFHCLAVALSAPDDPVPLIAHGTWEGRIATVPQGRGGFGYDPVFFVPELNLTAAEMSPAVKNEVSHRAVALRILVLKMRDRAMAGR